MKRCAFILFSGMLFATNLFAQFRDDDTKGEFFQTFGPIKHMTSIVFVDGREEERDVEVFDSIGIKESYRIGKSGVIIKSSQRIYQYTDSNSCRCFYHKNLGGVRGPESDEDTIVFYFNAKGDKMRSYDMYSNLVDSFVYDTHGRLLEKHHRDFETGKMELQYEYTYDSQGRLVREKCCEYYSRYSVTYEYQSNGNYKRYYTGNGAQHVSEWFVNDKGQPVKLKLDEAEIIFSKYDQYGNWLRYEIKPIGSNSRTVSMVVIRSIEYFDP